MFSIQIIMVSAKTILSLSARQRHRFPPYRVMVTHRPVQRHSKHLQPRNPRQFKMSEVPNVPIRCVKFTARKNSQARTTFTPRPQLQHTPKGHFIRGTPDCEHRVNGQRRYDAQGLGLGQAVEVYPGLSALFVFWTHPCVYFVG